MGEVSTLSALFELDPMNKDDKHKKLERTKLVFKKYIINHLLRAISIRKSSLMWVGKKILCSSDKLRAQ